MVDRIFVDNGRFIDLDTISEIICMTDGNVKVQFDGISEVYEYRLKECTSKKFAEIWCAYKREQQDIQLQQFTAIKSVAGLLTQLITHNEIDISMRGEQNGEIKSTD